MPGADGSLQADRAREQLEELRAALNREIARLLHQLNTGNGTDALVRDRESLAVMSRVRDEVVAKLRESGVVITSVTEEGAADAARAVAEKYDFGDFTPDTSKHLEQIVREQLKEVTDAFKVAEKEIVRAMRIGSRTSAPLGELIDKVAQEIDTSFAKAQASVDAAIMGSGRALVVNSVKEANADGGAQIGFRLIGPMDGKTRAFCRALVKQTRAKPVTQAELEALDNGSDLAPEFFGGGYNCRHTWAPALIEGGDEA